MPTGYTSPVQNNPDYTFEEFVWDCARAFGALVMMRDEPCGAPIPESFPHDNYYERRLVDVTKNLEEALGRSIDEWEAAWKGSTELARENHKKYLAEKATTKARYEAMLARVIAWEPPSAEHVQLRKFMIDQLHESIRFDCITLEVAELPLNEFIMAQIDGARSDVEYCTKKAAEERERVERRNEWLRLLRESVPVPERLSRKSEVPA